MSFSSRLEIMSLKRKYDFDQLQSSSTSCPEDHSITTKYIKTDEFFNEHSLSSDERKSSRLNIRKSISF
jgi:hypothetical protein